MINDKEQEHSELLEVAQDNPDDMNNLVEFFALLIKVDERINN